MSSLVQELFDQSIEKMTLQVYENIQLCHASTEEMLAHLEMIRQLSHQDQSSSYLLTLSQEDHQESKINQKFSMLNGRILRMQSFIFLKKEVLEILQKDSSAIYEHILQALSKEKLLSPLVSQQKMQIKPTLSKICKRIFISEESLEDYLEENQLAKRCLNCLLILRQEFQQKHSNGESKYLPARQKLKIIDQMELLINQKINRFYQKIVQFNYQILKFIQKMHQFEVKIIHQFSSFLADLADQTQIPVKKIQNSPSSKVITQNEHQVMTQNQHQNQKKNNKESTPRKKLTESPQNVFHEEYENLIKENAHYKTYNAGFGFENPQSNVYEDQRWNYESFKPQVQRHNSPSSTFNFQRSNSLAGSKWNDRLENNYLVNKKLNNEISNLNINSRSVISNANNFGGSYAMTGGSYVAGDNNWRDSKSSISQARQSFLYR